MDDAAVVSLVTGVGAVVSAVAGLWLVLREIRSRQHAEVVRLDDELEVAWEELVAYHRYAHDLRTVLADFGLEVPPLPPPPDRPVRTPEPSRRRHWWRRRRG